jgi:hypothetical protein
VAVNEKGFEGLAEAAKKAGASIGELAESMKVIFTPGRSGLGVMRPAGSPGAPGVTWNATLGHGGPGGPGGVDPDIAHAHPRSTLVGGTADTIIIDDVEIENSIDSSKRLSIEDKPQTQGEEVGSW